MAKRKPSITNKNLLTLVGWGQYLKYNYPKAWRKSDMAILDKLIVVAKSGKKLTTI